jgi:hypothetical protein
MRFAFAGRIYRIRFKHEHHPNNDAPLSHCIPIMAGGTKYGKVRAVTECIIEVKRDDDRWAGWSWGVARCSLDDRFQKEIGRKLSLQRALIGTTKEFRTSVWAAYTVRSPKIVKVRREA